MGQTVPVTRFMALPPNAEVRGDIEAMALLAGQSVGLVHAITPAATLVRELVDDAARIVRERLVAAVGG